jgi:hypothetical protein
MTVATSVRQSPSGPFEELPKAGGVDSWNGRTGAVLPVAGDYDSDEITNSSGVGGASVSDALDALDVDIQAIQVAIANLDSSDIANASGVGGATVTDALNTLLAGGSGMAVGTFAARPAASGSVRQYFATDGVVGQWISDGAAWSPGDRWRAGYRSSRDRGLRCRLDQVQRRRHCFGRRQWRGDPARRHGRDDP